MSLPQCIPGHFLSFAEPPDDSFHFVGGQHDVRGAMCPNCRMPLLLHLTLGTGDKRLKLAGLGIPTIPLFYCMRCNLLEGDFVYRLINESCIEILAYVDGADPGYRSDWDKEIGLDAFPRRRVSLLPISKRIQELLDILGRWSPSAEDEITEIEQAELKVLVASYRDTIIARAYFDVINQVGGRPFLNQGLRFPDCLYCGRGSDESRRMTFLANLTNAGDFVVSSPSVYITFFICLSCRTVHVEHRL